jgi:hypothetical protein
MASQHQSDDPHPGDPTDSPPAPDKTDESDHSDHSDQQPPRIIRLRVAPWDLICTISLLILLIVLATATSWPAKLFGFLKDVCTEDTCGQVPFGLDFYIYPVVWGGVGAAITAAGIGPFVSLLKGWYMSFWPVLAMAAIMVSSLTGTMITMFSARYWY